MVRCLLRQCACQLYSWLTHGIVYGGVIDIFLALCPWFVIRKLLLQKREKIGLAIAMGLGVLTGTIVILRAFFQFIQIDNTYRSFALYLSTAAPC